MVLFGQDNSPEIDIIPHIQYHGVVLGRAAANRNSNNLISAASTSAAIPSQSSALEQNVAVMLTRLVPVHGLSILSRSISAQRFGAKGIN